MAGPSRALMSGEGSASTSYRSAMTATNATDTTAWHVGRATITPVIEVETITSPRFLFKDLNKAGVLDIANRAPWLTDNFVDADGYLLQRVQCLVIDVDGVRVGRHLRRQRQAAGEPRLEQPAAAVPDRFGS